jgi:hypothetical protein
MTESIRRRGREWRERLLDLREALAELYAAEGEALSRDLARWGKALAIAVLLLLAAVMLSFWLIAVLVGFLVALLSVWLPVWGATLVTAGVLLLVIGGLGMVGWRRLSALGGPVERVTRRWRDHVSWWQERVFDSAAHEEGEHDGEGP